MCKQTMNEEFISLAPMFLTLVKDWVTTDYVEGYGYGHWVSELPMLRNINS